MMNNTDKIMLSSLIIVVLIVITGVFILLQPSWEIIVDSIIPELNLTTIAVVSLCTVVGSIFFSIAFLGENTKLSPNTTTYFYIASPLEELLTTFNSVVIAKTLGFSFGGILVLGLIQAFIFMILHKTLNLRLFAGALFRFYMAMSWGIIPAMLGHLAGNLALRKKNNRMLGI